MMESQLLPLAIKNPHLKLDEWTLQEMRQFCQRWQITELAFFGSVLRDDFTMESDVDVLVVFAPEANWGLLEHVQMEQELSRVLGRKVDLVTKRAVERSQNKLFQQEVLNTAQVVFLGA